MLERSARGGGLHLVFRRHPEMDQEANLRWASDLLGVEYDAGAKDITRVFFATTSEDLLYLHEDLFDNAECESFAGSEATFTNREAASADSEATFTNKEAASTGSETTSETEADQAQPAAATAAEADSSLPPSKPSTGGGRGRQGAERREGREDGLRGEAFVLQGHSLRPHHREVVGLLQRGRPPHTLQPQHAHLRAGRQPAPHLRLRPAAAGPHHPLLRRISRGGENGLHPVGPGREDDADATAAEGRARRPCART